MNVIPVPLRRRAPDLEVRRLMLQLRLSRLADVPKLAVATARRNWQLSVKAFASRDDVASVSDEHVAIDGRRLALRVYRAEIATTEPAPALLWFHGGGFVLGDLYTAGATCRALARCTGAVVIAVDYRLAPEHALEDACDDAVAALRWLREHADRLAIDRTRIAVGGDSAGGTLAALLAQHASALEGLPLALQLLVYPATDLARDASRSRDTSPMFSGEHVAWLRKHMARRSNLSDPHLSPLRGASIDKVAPTLMLTVGFDPLRDEALACAQRLVDCGVPTRVLHYPGQFHGFLCFDRVLAGARDAFARMGTAVAAHFAGEPLVTGLDRVSISGRGSMSDLRWLQPRQRWNELQVGWLFVRDRLFGSTSIERTSTDGRI